METDGKFRGQDRIGMIAARIASGTNKIAPISLEKWQKPSVKFVRSSLIPFSMPSKHAETPRETRQTERSFLSLKALWWISEKYVPSSANPTDYSECKIPFRLHSVRRNVVVVVVANAAVQVQNQA